MTVRIGEQVPTNYWVPHYARSRGDQAIAFLKAIGFYLDPWQQLVLRDLLGERDDGKWASLEAVLLVPRQNGKTAVTEALAICHLFLFGSRLIIHTAQLFDTAFESYLRICEIIESCPDLDRLVKQKLSGNGKVGILLKNGARLLYKARGKGQGRGFSGDLVILDEAYDLDPDMMAALIPALSARKNPQVVYTSSTGDEDSAVLIKARDRGLNEKGAGRIALFEWCADPKCSLDNREQWLQANPGIGYRLDEEYIASVERGSLDDKKFARERLGLWHDNSLKAPIDVDLWNKLDEPDSQIVSRVCVAIDASPDRSFATIAIAGYTADGRKQVEVESSGAGVSWCVDAIDAMFKTETGEPPLAVAVQAGARAGSLIPELEALEIEVIPFGARDIMGATGFISDCVEDKSIVHLADKSIEAGLRGARSYNIGGKVSDATKTGDEAEYNGWGWSRADSTIDITGVCAVTYALWALNMKRAEAVVEKKPYEGKPRGGRVW